MGSDYLYDTPSYLTGFARALDLWDAFSEYNVSPTPAMADAIAIYSDWRSVGEDLLVAARQVSADPRQLTLFPLEAE
jgi:hypothetical protein